MSVLPFNQQMCLQHQCSAGFGFDRCLSTFRIRRLSCAIMRRGSWHRQEEHLVRFRCSHAQNSAVSMSHQDTSTPSFLSSSLNSGVICDCSHLRFSKPSRPLMVAPVPTNKATVVLLRRSLIPSGRSALQHAVASQSSRLNEFTVV